MPGTDPAAEVRAHQAISEFLYRRRSSAATKAYLVSYPRSGNTLVRKYFSILQGRPQFSLYDGDVVSPDGPALTRALDHVEIIKSHQMPPPEGAMIYLVRDGRNAALSFLYMSFLFGGHRYSNLSEVYDGLRHLDEEEGSWAEHVSRAVEQSKTRQVLFVRYEDLMSAPEATLSRMVSFLGAEILASVLSECVSRQRASDDYAGNLYNGYLYEPMKGSIYDILKRHRRENYWRLIFDSRSKRYFHEGGSTRFLLQFRYERSSDWWTE
jgi:hypothetical protein